MLPLPDRVQLRCRLPRLAFGLVLFGIGLALMVRAELGLAPWEVFHQGITRHTGIPIGTVGILTGIVVLLGWIPLRERIGLGTVLNVMVIGVVIDLTLLAHPTVEHAVARWTLLGGGLLLVGLGSGFYIGAGLGPGPRDGLMTGLSRRGLGLGRVRTTIELLMLGAGWLLGGTVGVGTVAFSFGIGPLVALFLPLLAVEPLPGAPPIMGSRRPRRRGGGASYATPTT